MTSWKAGLYLCTALAWCVGLPEGFAQQLNPQQIQIIRDTAASICNTIKEAKGQKSESQIQGEIKAQLNGLVGKVIDVGGSGKGSLNNEEFEGLSREATATALEGDRSCRERLFNKMFDRLGATPSTSGQFGTTNDEGFTLSRGQSKLLTKDNVVLAVIGHPFAGNGPLMGIRLAGQVKGLQVGSSVNFPYSQGTCSITLLQLIDNGGGRFYLKC